MVPNLSTTHADHLLVWLPHHSLHHLSSDTWEADNVVGLENPGNSHQAAGPGPGYPQACSVVIGSTARSPLPLARGIFNTNRRSFCCTTTAVEAPPDTVHHSRLFPFLTENQQGRARIIVAKSPSFLPEGGVRCREPPGHLPVRNNDGLKGLIPPSQRAPECVLYSAAMKGPAGAHTSISFLLFGRGTRNPLRRGLKGTSHAARVDNTSLVWRQRKGVIYGREAQPASSNRAGLDVNIYTTVSTGRTERRPLGRGVAQGKVALHVNSFKTDKSILLKMKRLIK